MRHATALVLAPHGRDGEIVGQLLEDAGLHSSICLDAAGFHEALSEDVAFAVATDEALGAANLRAISDWIERQPSWSDMPFIVLTRRGGGVERNPAASRLSDVLRNVSFLERPFHPTTFVSLARTAMGSRRRQFEARARVDELRRLTETLEIRVAERTRALESAHAEVLQEIAQRERAEDQLRQAQKMEMIGQLTGGVAHDFNNLLMAVLSNLELLRRHIPDDPKATRLVEGAVQGAQRGAALTQRLLAFARRQALVVEPRDLCELVRSMTALIERSLGSGIEMRTSLPDGLPNALIDGNQVELALLNLAVNARDAMPEGGVLRIEVDEVRAEPSEDLAAGAYLRLAVTDTGQGMDAETLQKATEPFFSTKELGKGTGLGLSMVHGLAAQLKGALRLASEVGSGTRAELWVPVAEAAILRPAETAPEAPMPAPSSAGDPARRYVILTVDDDALIAMSTVDMLEDLGHEVVEANSGASALQILRADRPIDLMVTDFSMPGMNGAQLARAARDLRPGLPILLATGYAELPAGFDLDLPRLGKPYRQEQLAEQIAKLLQSASS